MTVRNGYLLIESKVQAALTDEQPEETSDDQVPTSARPQQHYDHRLRHLVHRTGDVTVATNLALAALMTRTRARKCRMPVQIVLQNVRADSSA
jgi:hypothetical protein